MYRDDERNFEELKGKVLSGITGGVGSEEMIFTTIDGEQYKLYHVQD